MDLSPVFLTLVAVTYVGCTELVPERYLRPRDFNHHPFTDVGEGPSLKSAPSLPENHPYAILSSKKPREGRQFPEQDVVLYPNPPAEVLPRKQLLHVPVAVPVHVNSIPTHVNSIPAHVNSVQAQPLNYGIDPYSQIPKNYAFSYSVKDHHSGDDFSHSQAHNGKATRGQYRVKLPDGRVQVVSYTADHKGYRADVQYEGETAKHFAPSASPTPVYEHPKEAHNAYAQKQPSFAVTPTAFSPIQHVFTPTPATYAHEQPAYTEKPSLYSLEATYTPTPATYSQLQHHSPTYSDHEYVQAYAKPSAGYEQAHYAPTPSPYEGHYAAPSPAPYDRPYPSPTPTAYAQEAYASPTPETYNHQQEYQSPSYATNSPGLQAYASPSPDSYEQHQYVSPSAPEYGYGPSSPSPFSVQPFLRSTPTPFTNHKFVTSTEAPNGRHILVTPRTQFNEALSRRGFGERQQLHYKFSSPS